MFNLEREDLWGSYQCIETPDVGVKEAELDLSQWCTVIGQQAEGTNSNRGNSI